MGFDEVSKEWREDGTCKNGAFSVCADGLPLLLESVITQPWIFAGVYDKPAEKDGSQRAHVESLVRAGDCM